MSAPLIIGLSIAAIALFLIGIYNKLTKQRILVKEGWVALARVQGAFSPAMALAMRPGRHRPHPQRRFQQG